MSLPIRVRLTAWYAALLALILVALGSFLVLQLRADVQAGVDREIWRAAAPIAERYASGGADAFREVASSALPRGEGAAQVLDRGGNVLASYGPPAVARPIVPADVRAAALLGAPSVVSVRLDGLRFRAGVSTVRRLGNRRVLVVAESLREAETPVRRVLTLLLLAGPTALAATAVAGWWLARQALGPVDRMASAADAIEIDRLDERVAVPRAADELGHLAVTLNAMLDRLEAGVTLRRRLVGDASHELRTPLAVMRAELDVTLRGDELPDEAREALESTREEVDRMSRMVDNLLTLAQADEGRLALLRSRVDVRAVVDAAANPLRQLAEHKGVRLVVSGVSADVDADPHRMTQALTNLIENAIKFSPAGGEVRVTAWENTADVGVTVDDDGPGIPKDAMPHLFDRFFRVDRARTRGAGGSGLGLAICREIARAHGGRVSVRSQEGRGSTFSLVLPRAGGG